MIRIERLPLRFRKKLYWSTFSLKQSLLSQLAICTRPLEHMAIPQWFSMLHALPSS
jgi:hypothetical protein